MGKTPAFRFLLAFLGWLIGYWTPVSATDSSRVDLSTPRAAVKTHLNNLQPDHYFPQAAAEVISARTGTLDERERRVIQLKRVLDAKGYFIDFGEIPDQADYTTPEGGRARYVLRAELPEVYLTRQNGRWRYSQETFAAIPQLYDEVFPLGMDKLLHALPHFGAFLGLSSAQWIALGLLLLVAGIVHQVLRRIFRWIVNRALRRMGIDEMARRHLRPVVGPLSLAVVFFALEHSLKGLQLPVGWMVSIDRTFDIAIPIFIAMVFYRAIAIFNDYFARRAAKTEGRLDDQLVPLVRKATKTLVVVLALVYILNNFGISVTALVTGLSIGGLALALAAQDTLKNFFGSLLIFVDRPFGVGDWIATPDLEGIVEEVGFRSTRVRTFRGSLVYTPNGRLADSTIDNIGLRIYRRYLTTLALTYDTPPKVIDPFVEGVREIVRQHPKTRKDLAEIHLHDFGSHSLNIIAYIYFDVDNFTDELHCRHEIIREILLLAERMGVRFAFPTQTLHLESAPGQQPLTPRYEGSPQHYQQMAAARGNGR
jgi:MscS family membrane protein